MEAIAACVVEKCLGVGEMRWCGGIEAFEAAGVKLLYPPIARKTCRPIGRIFLSMSVYAVNVSGPVELQVDPACPFSGGSLGNSVVSACCKMTARKRPVMRPVSRDRKASAMT